MTHVILTSLICLLWVSHGVAQADEKFEHVAIHFEQNASDKDAEIIVEATGNDAGLATLHVAAPDGRTVIDFKAPDSKMGLRHFSFESPEPKNDGRLQADFPEGEYTFTGRTVTGVALRGKAMLSHTLPDPASFVRPRPDTAGAPVKGLQIQWRSVKDLAACIIVIEQEDTGLEMRAKLPGAATTFAVPDGFLAPDTEYKLAIGTVAKKGNTSFVETTFTTAAKP